MRNLKSKNKYIKKYKPTSPSLRSRIILRKPKKVLPIKNQIKHLKYDAGRNASGSITTRHHGSRAHKRNYRILDFNRVNAPYSLSTLLTVENDPNRSANIARYLSPKLKSYYILAPHSISESIQGPKYPYLRYLKDGDTVPLMNLPVGSKCYNIQNDYNSKPKFALASGSAATLLKIQDSNATIRLPSKKLITINANYLATIGIPSNIYKNLTVKGKAGANR
jgi:large subunit ribosomal protein L2